MKSNIPVTVLSGYLGSGKTTLLNHLLHNQTDWKIAVVVNDMSEVNIDASMVKQGRFKRTEEKLVELQNGCICCTLREDLIQEVEKLAAMDIDYILIESTGISEPIPVAQSFTYEDEEPGIHLGENCRLDTMVTVVDANRFWDDYASGETLLDRQQAADETDAREVIDLLIDQIEFANVIVLNKIDLVKSSDRDELKAVLHQLNPEARIVESEFSRVAPEEVLNTGRFDFEKVSQGAGWIKELNEDHVPESDEYNISSFVYRSKKPFHPERLMAWLENWPSSIIRAKGFFWIASRNDIAGLLSQAGTSLSIQGAGEWIAVLPETDQQEILAEDPELLTRWDDTYGDRLTELVFIGIEMDQKKIIETLDQCLLSEREMEEDWKTFADPLPEFTGDHPHDHS
ncbi:zinc transporter [Halobacillus andaensis]|uniref:Zinc transporter n=1 Tax=Halobacillus andaensis TaxID=1176239 RepID=A0A917ETT5_HALAA|nr:GTP-binding protein [Halobacillus andaensis]MBP2003996.1 G3E family GTPase [Halobacillus andaensis]GGF15006.1 zinc transporter [Halobacillus andaensis]